MMERFTTVELENLVEKFPYFQQAHLLLAKKYQQENDARFDQQLQIAALYTQDRELLFTLFSEIKEIQAKPVIQVEQPLVEEKRIEIPAAPIIEEVIVAPVEPAAIIVNQELAQDMKETGAGVVEVPIEEQVMPPIVEEVIVPEVPVTEEKRVEEIQVSIPVIEQEAAPLTEEIEETPVEEKEATPFVFTAPHTFDEWLKVFNKVPKEPLEEVKVEEEPTDDDLNKLIRENVSVDFLHDLVKEETQYSRGLDKFIEDQIQKHKQVEVTKPAADNELAPELITETMAKVYEMQRKYSKAIKAYETLSLKFPEKSGLFAARINYLKNIT
ncbi:MAG: hypothetical protein JWO06_3772 [Bacteroidota bacterium]|nr:hypothetical protein [Bacteroidota bacterium]